MAEEPTESRLTRKTANLNPRAKRALDDLTDWEFGYDDTESINRALIMTAYLMGEVKAGGEVMVTRPGEMPMRVVFL
jgi:hypothetical protein